MQNLDRNDYGKLVIRIMVAGLILSHGVSKLMDPSGTLGWIGNTLNSLHLPSFLAYGVYVGEVVAPLMILAGWHSRIGAGLIVINMCFALLIAHRPEVFDFSGGTWAIEHQMFYILSAVAIIIFGSGRAAIKPD